MIKRISLLVRRPELSREEFVRHWADIHGPLARKVPGVRRYVQNHIEGAMRRPDIAPLDLEIDGIAELWYDDRETMQESIASPEAKELFRDGAEFIGTILTYVVDERVVVPAAGDASA